MEEEYGSAEGGVKEEAFDRLRVPFNPQRGFIRVL
jgi:hypothetical protein